MKRIFLFVSIAALSLVATGSLSAQENHQIGTWKLNTAKSKFVNMAAPKNETRTVEAKGAGAKYSFDGVAADGSSITYTFTTNYDEKDAAITGAGFPNGADTIAVKRVSADSSTSTAKKAGKVVQRTTTVVSADGKVTTLTAKGTTAQGQATSSTTVWEKQ